MDVDVTQPLEYESEQVDEDQILDFLSNCGDICFKSQQRDEDDLTKEEKLSIALKVYNDSKLIFLLRFGKYLKEKQLRFFEKFYDDKGEVEIVLKDLLNRVSKRDQKSIKNRRYEALKQMISDQNYFSETEMMKRNPLLYEQLIGQYLTEEEKTERHRIKIDEDTTLVKFLMEGIERDHAKTKKEAEEQLEIEMTVADEDTVCDADDDMPEHYTQWGEFEEDKKKIKVKKSKVEDVTFEEQQLLKEEFISTMYEHFLDGKDEDFDYNSVDNNEKYDNHVIVEYDEEDKYFDSEEPNDDPIPAQDIESEDDELDIFMNTLNHNDSDISKLSRKMTNL